MIFPFTLAYAEIHYRFKYFFSLLIRNEPEIIADAPHRINPNSNLPILLLIKDADKYPIVLHSISIRIKKNNALVSVHNYNTEKSVRVFGHWWWNVIEISLQKELEQLCDFFEIDVEIEFERNGKRKIITNNNLPTSSKKSLKIFRSKTNLPTLPNWIYGDTHIHSNYTEDQVEFGAPINASIILSKAIGLSFFCVCDHSYDLDDRLDSYLHNDSSLPKWNLQQKEIDEINLSENTFVVVRGVEVTARNSYDRNVHFLLWGTKKFFHGSGDSAEKWFRLKSENSITEIISNITPITVTYASHPTEKVPFLHRLFFGRDEWSLADMKNNGLDGLQILNGEANENFFKGIEYWKQLLSEGKKLFIAAGNDAHGNFNRYVQLSIPFVKIAEKDSQIFGRMRTALFCESLSENSIVHSLKNGKSVITNGPLVIFSIESENHQFANIGETIQCNKFVVKIQGVSTTEFGEFTRVKILCGSFGANETVLEEKIFHNEIFDIHFLSEWKTVTTFSYIRVEAFTKNGVGYDAEGFCYTNPIWIVPE